MEGMAAKRCRIIAMTLMFQDNHRKAESHTASLLRTALRGKHEACSATWQLPGSAAVMSKWMWVG
jgi:hypothetical protein